MFGHDKSRVIDEDIDDLLCSICFNVCNNPMAVYCCQKINCKHCLDLWLKTHKSCPNCRRNLVRDGLTAVPRVVTDRIGRLQIKCHRFADGCPAVVTIDNMDRHLEKCEFDNCPVCKSKKTDQKHQCLPYLLKTINMLKIENNRLRLSNECLIDSIEDMTRKEVTIDFTVENFRRMKRRTISPVVYMNCLPWRLNAQPWITTDRSGQTIKNLALFVECCACESELKCKTIVQLMILSQKEGTDDLKKSLKHTFTIMESSRGFSDFATFVQICNPVNGYITDGKVLLSAIISVDNEDEDSDPKPNILKKVVPNDDTTGVKNPMVGQLSTRNDRLPDLVQMQHDHYHSDMHQPTSSPVEYPMNGNNMASEGVPDILEDEWGYSGHKWLS